MDVDFQNSFSYESAELAEARQLIQKSQSPWRRHRRFLGCLALIIMLLLLALFPGINATRHGDAPGDRRYTIWFSETASFLLLILLALGSMFAVWQSLYRSNWIKRKPIQYKLELNEGGTRLSTGKRCWALFWTDKLILQETSKSLVLAGKVFIVVPKRIASTPDELQQLRQYIIAKLAT